MVAGQEKWTAGADGGKLQAPCPGETQRIRVPGNPGQRRTTQSFFHGPQGFAGGLTARQEKPVRRTSKTEKAGREKVVAERHPKRRAFRGCQELPQHECEKRSCGAIRRTDAQELMKRSARQAAARQGRVDRLESQGQCVAGLELFQALDAGAEFGNRDIRRTKHEYRMHIVSMIRNNAWPTAFCSNPLMANARPGKCGNSA